MRDDDLVPRLETRPEEAVGNQVDALGGAADEDDLGAVAGADELANAAPGALVRERGPLAEQVHAAVDVGIVLGVVPGHGVDDGSRFLRGGGAVEIHQAPISHRASQNGEVAPYGLRI